MMQEMDLTEELETYWISALPLFKKSFTDAIYDSVIRPLIPYSLKNNIITLKADMDFFKTTINNRYLFEITRCLRMVIDEDIEVRIVSPEDFGENIIKKNENYAKTNLRTKYLFETFVEGKCNEFAYAAARAVAQNPGNTGYNPLFLYGGVGLGKTHLVHAIGNYVAEKNPSLQIMYVSTETFTNEFIFAIREKCTQEFKNKYRAVDLLLLDDIQFLDGKEETQEEMFHTFNTLYNDSKQIVLTSDQPPKSLSTLEKRLTSRFAMGLLVDITMPDYETRTAILEKKLDLEHLSIPQNVKEFITRNIVSNVRDLEGALNKVTAYAKLYNKTINLETAKDALRDQLIGQQKPEITVEYIQQVVASHYRITVEDIKGRKRTQNIVNPRQIAMYFCRKILDISLPECGKAFGGRDHSTVIHSCDKVSAEYESDSIFKNVINELEKRIKGE